MITMSTVGYGDIYPVTKLGKLICFTLCLWGMFLMSIVVIILFQSLELSYEEKKTIMIFNKLELKEKLKEKSASLIQLKWRSKKSGF